MLLSTLCCWQKKAGFVLLFQYKIRPAAGDIFYPRCVFRVLWAGKKAETQRIKLPKKQGAFRRYGQEQPQKASYMHPRQDITRRWYEQVGLPLVKRPFFLLHAKIPSRPIFTAH
jgi:hypothetical protein